MTNLLQKSPFFRNEKLNSLNETVLKIIHQKKYPLNYNSINSQHFATHLHLHKISTLSSELSHKSSAQKLKYGLTSGQWDRKGKENNVDDCSMGEHLQTIRGKQLNSLYSSSQCFDEVSKKISGFLWQKKKERGLSPSKSDNQRASQCSIQNQKKRQVKNYKPQYSLSKMIKNLRKNLLNQLLNQQELSQQQPVTTLSIKPQKPYLKPIDFYQGHKERSRLVKKYPIKAGKIRQDINKQLIADMKSDLKESQYYGDDKYNKMRIMANHKKIISLGL